MIFETELKSAVHLLEFTKPFTTTSATGIGAMAFLLVTLTITPLRKLTGWQWLLKLRRLFGRFTFIYAAIHVFCYIKLDHVYSFARFLESFSHRPAAIYGITAFVLMIPLIITSNNFMVKKLGSNRWQLLHKLIYIAAITALIHYFIATKYITGAIIAAVILTLLLGTRLYWYMKEEVWSGIISRIAKKPAQPIEDLV